MAGRGRDRRLEMTDSPVRNKRPVKNDPECETSRYHIKTDNEPGNYSWVDRRSFILQWWSIFNHPTLMITKKKELVD